MCRTNTTASHLPSAEPVAVWQERESEVNIDDALAASFPASDPPAWNPGLARPCPDDPLSDGVAETGPNSAVPSR